MKEDEMGKGRSPRLNPLKIIIWWIAGIVFIAVIFVLPSFFGNYGGDQTPLVRLTALLLIGCIGIFVLAIATIFVYFAWFKRHWYVNAFFICISFPLIYRTILTGFTSSGSYMEFETIDHADTVKVITEYFSIESGRIKSTYIWRNGLPDSVWVYYNERGEVVKKEFYDSGNLTKVVSEH